MPAQAGISYERTRVLCRCVSAGVVLAFNYMAQTLGCIVMGHVSDRYGRKNVRDMTPSAAEDKKIQKALDRSVLLWLILC